MADATPAGGYWGRTALYRLFGDDDTLLYVGIANDPDLRWQQHSKTKHWWPQVARRSVEWFDKRTDAAAAEETAIRTEQPRHNQMHSTIRPPARQHGDGGRIIHGPQVTVTTESFSITAAMANLAWASRTAARARWELGEFPITYLTKHGQKAVAIVPSWMGKWLEAHAAEMLASLNAEAAAD